MFDINQFVNNIERYSEETKYDYTYYLITHELQRMKIADKVGKLEPKHMSPILLFLRDWMPSGWTRWSERTGKRWRMDSRLCEALNGLEEELTKLRDLDIEHFKPNKHGNAVRRIYKRIYELRLGVSEEAIATVTSKIMHLLNSKLFVMWDTRIINSRGLRPNADGYLEFLTMMNDTVKQLKPHLGKIEKKAEELRKRASEVYGIEICSEKSLAKLVDENNWISR